LVHPLSAATVFEIRLELREHAFDKVTNMRAVPVDVSNLRDARACLDDRCVGVGPKFLHVWVGAAKLFHAVPEILTESVEPTITRRNIRRILQEDFQIRVITRLDLNTERNTPDLFG
jgi:hypothetical protein